MILKIFSIKNNIEITGINNVKDVDTLLYRSKTVIKISYTDVGYSVYDMESKQSVTLHNVVPKCNIEYDNKNE